MGLEGALQLAVCSDTGEIQETRMVEVVFSQFLNHHGTLFGGHALRMMDTAAFVAATREAIAAAVGGLPSQPLTRQAGQ
jgi:acyl-CoA hydrolase